MIPILFYYHRLHRYSLNALAGALDSDPDLSDEPVDLPKNAGELQRSASSLLRLHERIVVAVSMMTPQFEEMRDTLRQMRSSHGDRVVFIAGGPHATARPREVLESGIDIVCRGEAEVSFPLLVKRLAEKGGCHDIAGISFREGGTVVVNPGGSPVDIDGFFSFSPKRGMFGPIEITRGCPFACCFCQTSSIFGVQPRHRSIQQIVQQAAALRSRNRRVVRLLSPNAFSYGSMDGRRLNPDAVCELLSTLRKTVSPGDRIIFGYFPSEVRPEHVTREILDLLRHFADNDEIVIGAQSGSGRMLEACHRAHTVEHVLSAVALARREGYKVIVDFILGLPGENEQDERESIAVINEVARLGARIHPHAFVPLPQTAFSAKRPGKITSGVISALDELNARKMIYGDWTEQRRLANRVYRHMRRTNSSASPPATEPQHLDFCG